MSYGKNEVFKRCGYRWVPRAEHPKGCPFCKSYRWNQVKRNPLTPMMTKEKAYE